MRRHFWRVVWTCLLDFLTEILLTVGMLSCKLWIEVMVQTLANPHYDDFSLNFGFEQINPHPVDFSLNFGFPQLNPYHVWSTKSIAAGRAHIFFNLLVQHSPKVKEAGWLGPLKKHHLGETTLGETTQHSHLGGNHTTFSPWGKPPSILTPWGKLKGNFT